MRQAFFSTLCNLAKENSDIFLIVGDLGYSFVEPFAQAFPNQYLNAGIAEQNMIGMAAGLAMTGKRVFVYSIVPFVTMRCYEQVRNDIGYHKLPVVIVGTGAGISYSSLGATHHALEDIALMSSIPGMNVFTPSSQDSVVDIMNMFTTLNGPSYLRLDKHSSVQIEGSTASSWHDGASVHAQGDTVACVGIGATLDKAAAAYRSLQDKGYTPTLVSLERVKPLNTAFLYQLAHNHDAVFTFEDHSMLGGVGQMIASYYMQHLPKKIVFRSFGYPDSFVYRAGSTEYMRTIHGLDSNIIQSTIIQLLIERGVMPQKNQSVRHEKQV